MIEEQQGAATIAVENIVTIRACLQLTYSIYLHVCGVKLAGFLDSIINFPKRKSRMSWGLKQRAVFAAV